LHERVLDNLAEMTILARIHHYIVHVAIVIVPVCLGRLWSAIRIFGGGMSA
jgi:hypothetical protein